jgi:hypothetical protein
MLLSDLIAFIKKTHKDFPWADDAIGQYLSWAFSKDCLFVESDENGLSGMMIAYPLADHADGSTKSLLPVDYESNPNWEKWTDICVMDAIYTTKESRLKIVDKFMKRFPNWEHQTKWAIRGKKTVKLTNRYIQLTGTTL